MSSEISKVRRDEEGYLFDAEDWTPELAQALAVEESLRLESQHWLVIQFIRDYYFEHSITPDIRHVAKFIAQQIGCDKKAGKKRIFELFPYGYVKQACKIAGMKRPRAWSTG